MGLSTNGILAYGYDLGGDESAWQIEEVEPFEPWEPGWSTPDEDGRRDLAEDAEWALLGSVMFTERDDGSDGYRERKRAALELVGVELTSYASNESPSWLLSAHTITVYRGSVEHVDFAALAGRRAREDWDGKLARATAALGITPMAPGPAWLLASYVSQ